MPLTTSESVIDSEPAVCYLKTANHPKVVIMGSGGVGKTSIVSQFLYDEFPLDHVPTVQDMHKNVYHLSDARLSLDLLDTSGTYQFPAMRDLAIKKSDAFILVYAINDIESFNNVCGLKDLILDLRPKEMKTPIVVVGNKCDLEEDRKVPRDITESVVTIDWENGFVECSAKKNKNILKIFQTVLAQARVCNTLVTLITRRSSLPNNPTCPQLRHTIGLKRHSCSIQ